VKVVSALCHRQGATAVKVSDAASEYGQKL